MRALLISLLILAGIQAQAESTEFVASNLKGLTYENLAGDLKVETTTSDKAVVTAKKKSFGKYCKLTTKVNSGTLLVKVEDTSDFNNSDCDVDFAIKVPKELALDLQIGAGNLVIRDTKGSVNAKIASGKLDIAAEVTDLQAKLATGSIVAKGLTGSADVKVANGDSQLQYKAVPSKGGVHFDVANGDATVLLPESSKVSTSLKSMMGDLKNEVGHDPKANFKISMSSANGDLIVKALK